MPRLHEDKRLKQSGHLFSVDPRILKIDPAFNVRDLDSPDERADLDELKASIRQNGVLVPLEIRRVDDDIFIVGGHRRHRAVTELIEDGVDIKTVPAIAEAARVNDAERDARLIDMNGGKPLTAMQKAVVVGRLLGHGWTREQIAARYGWTEQTIRNHEDALALPAKVQDQVRAGDVTVTTALAVTREVGEQRAAETIAEAKVEAEAAGKAKVTPKIAARAVAKTKGTTAPAPAAPRSANLQRDREAVLVAALREIAINGDGPRDRASAAATLAGAGISLQPKPFEAAPIRPREDSEPGLPFSTPRRSDAECIADARRLLQAYHDATIEHGMMHGEVNDLADQIEALAVEMNGGSRFGMAAPGGGETRLADALRAPNGTLPLWGQPGEYTVELPDGERTIPTKIETDGLFGIGDQNFGCYAVDPDLPFISHTGFRSFMTPEPPGPRASIVDWTLARIEQHLATDDKGKPSKKRRKLVTLDEETADAIREEMADERPGAADPTSTPATADAVGRRIDQALIDRKYGTEWSFVLPHLEAGGELRRNPTTKRFYVNQHGGLTDKRIAKLEVDGLIRRIGVDVYALADTPAPASDPTSAPIPVSPEDQREIEREILGVLSATAPTMPDELAAELASWPREAVSDAAMRLIARGAIMPGGDGYRLPPMFGEAGLRNGGARNACDNIAAAIADPDRD